MTGAKVAKRLRGLQDRLQAILDPSTTYVITQAAEEAKETHERVQNNKQTKWGYRITPRSALSFKTQKVDELGFEVRVDLYCEVRWKPGGILPVEQDVKVRVWADFEKEPDRHLLPHELEFKSSDPPHTGSAEIAYQRWQAEGAPTGERVIYRCHFDSANIGQNGQRQNGPLFHHQFGGASCEGEWFIFENPIPLPRLLHPPMDLVLACELVAANFYPNEYRDICDDPDWRTIIRESEKALLLPYLERSCDVINEAGDVLHESGKQSLYQYWSNQKPGV